MGFHRKAYYAAADQYGRAHYQRYERWARFWLALKLAGACGLALGCVFLYVTR